MKDEFRTTRSLASDIQRWHANIQQNKATLAQKFTTIKLKAQELNRDAEVSQIYEELTTVTSSLRDVLEGIENDLIEVGGVDVFSFGTEPDTIIESLRKMKEHSRRIDSKTELAVKLLLKSRGNGVLEEEISQQSRDIMAEMVMAEDRLGTIESCLDQTIEELDRIHQSSKELMKQRIL